MSYQNQMKIAALQRDKVDTWELHNLESRVKAQSQEIEELKGNVARLGNQLSSTSEALRQLVQLLSEQANVEDHSHILNQILNEIY